MAALLSSSRRRASEPLLDASSSAINANLRALLTGLPGDALLFRRVMNNDASTVVLIRNTLVSLRLFYPTPTHTHAYAYVCIDSRTLEFTYNIIVKARRDVSRGQRRRVASLGHRNVAGGGEIEPI